VRQQRHDDARLAEERDLARVLPEQFAATLGRRELAEGRFRRVQEAPAERHGFPGAGAACLDGPRVVVERLLRVPVDARPGEERRLVFGEADALAPAPNVHDVEHQHPLRAKDVRGRAARRDRRGETRVDQRAETRRVEALSRVEAAQDVGDLAPDRHADQMADQKRQLAAGREVEMEDRGPRGELRDVARRKVDARDQALAGVLEPQHSVDPDAQRSVRPVACDVPRRTPGRLLDELEVGFEAGDVGTQRVPVVLGPVVGVRFAD